MYLMFISNEAYHLTIMCGGIPMMGLFLVTAGLAATYGIVIFGPKLSLQNKIIYFSGNA
jgi:hypothetical protein